MTKPKTGRRASISERELVLEFLALYRTAKAAGGEVVLNPDDPPDEQARFYATDDALLSFLDHYVATGTFQPTLDLRPLLAKHISSSHARFEDKLIAVSETLNVSDRTAARLIARPSIKTAKG